MRNAGEREREDVSGLSVVQILHRGRMRVQIATGIDADNGKLSAAATGPIRRYSIECSKTDDISLS
jgi:hypothetical protein